MPRINQALHAFNRGEISKIALPRVDLAKLQLSAHVQVNWLPFKIGPMMLRPGMQFIGEVTGDNPAWLIDFVFSKTDTSLLELTDSNMRIWINDALLTRVAVGTTISDPTFAGGGSWVTTGTTSGCTSTIATGVATLLAAARGGLSRIQQTLTIAGIDQNKEHALRIVVTYGPVTIRIGSSAGLSDYMAQTTIDTGTHSLVFTPTSGTAVIQIESTDTYSKKLTSCNIESAGVVSIPTPWSASSLSSLRWTQSGDVIFVAAYGMQQYKIERRGMRPGARGWSVVKYRSNNGPFLNSPTIKANLTPGAYEGNTTLTSDQPFFQAGHVGALFQLFSHGQNNATVLGAGGAFTDPIRVTGVGSDRIFFVNISGTWVGTLSLERSIIGPTGGFQVVKTYTANNPSDTINDSTISGGSYNNIIAWYRVSFRSTPDYTSGNAVVIFGSGPAVNTSSPASFAGGQLGICRVTSYTSATSVNIEILSAFSFLGGTEDWQESTWSNVQGWPTSVAFQEGRLWWFSGGALPIAGSQSNFYTGFASTDVYLNAIGDAGVILESFGEGPSDRINWGLPLMRLLCGREQSIASIRSSSFDTPLTPTSFTVKDCSQQGATRLPALKIGPRGVFVQQAGTKVYELSFQGQNADYTDNDLTRLNVDIGKPGFVDVSRGMQPDTMLYFVRSDGQMACLLYDPSDEVEAWWRIMTLGVIENVRVMPNATGGSDDFVYMVVKRIINGFTVRFIEKFAQRSDCAGGLQNLQLDSFITYSGSATNTITLAQLPSTLVSVWADGAFIGTGTTDSSGVLSPLPDGNSHSNIVAGLAGAVVTYTGATVTSMSGLAIYNGMPGEFFCDQQPSGRMVHIGTLTPSGGAVTLPNGISSANIVGFFGFQAPFMSAKLAYAAQQGSSALVQKKHIDHVGLILYDASSISLQSGQRFDHLDALPLLEDGGAIASGAVWSEYDEPMIEVPGEWDTDARLCLLAQAPSPVKVGAAVIGIMTNEKT